MKQRLSRLALVVALLAFIGTAPGCATHVTGDTPIAASALKADAVVIRINELQATVIQICGPQPQCAPGGISTALARDLVQTCIDARTTLKRVPAGWQATVKAAWQQARPRFAGVTDVAILAALSAVDATMEVLR